MGQLSYPAGHAVIFREEAVILVAYNDGYGAWATHGTIGAGHTNAAGPPAVLPGQRITLDQAIAIFNADIRRVEVDVNRIIKVPLNQAQFDALVSFHYNTGGLTARLCQLRDQINAGDYSGAGFMGWTRAGDDPVALKGRRERERALFTQGLYGDMRVPVYDNWPGRPRVITLPPIPDALSPPLVEGNDAHVGKGGAIADAPALTNDGPGPGPAPVPPLTQSTTLWATLMAFMASGGGMLFSYLQYAGPAVALILVVGGLAAYIIHERSQRRKLSGV